MRNGIRWALAAGAAVGVLVLVARFGPKVEGQHSPKVAMHGIAKNLESEGFQGRYAPPMNTDTAAVCLTATPPPPPPPPPTPVQGVAVQAQMLIRTAQVRLEVPAFDQAAEALTRLAKEAGGYVADTTCVRSPAGITQGELVLRIPADRLEATGKSTRTLGRLLSESTQVEDVTKAFTDVEAKLAVRQESARRVRELLRHQAGNLKEVLEAEKELTRLQEEIEALEGERRFTLHEVRLTTLRVSLEEPEPISFTRPTSWSVLRDTVAGGALVVAESIAALLRVLLTLLPWALVALGLRWLVRRLLRPAPLPPSA